MRSVLFLMLFFPAFASAQINRSARELASERIQEYVAAKLFKGFSYKPGSFGKIKIHKEENNPDIAWMIEHKFEITEAKKDADQTKVPKPYKFAFYLDDKMKVLRAESFFTN